MTNTIIKFLKTHKFFLVFSLIYFFIQYWYFHRNNTIILGGEGNYWLDFDIYFKKYYFMWINNHTGSESTAPSNAFIFPFLFSFLKNIYIQSYLISLLMYFVPFISIYVLLYKIKKNPIIALAVSIFYVFNPYSIFINESQIMWSSGILSLLPLLTLIMFLYHHNKYKLFLYFGITSFIFSYSLVNPPLLLLTISSFPILLIIIHLLKYEKIKFKQFITEMFFIYLSFFLFNASWIFSWIITLPYAQSIYNLEIAKNWLATVSGNSEFIIKEIFSFSWLVPKSKDNNFLSTYYEFPIIKQILFFPFSLLICFLYKYKDKVVSLILFFLILLILLLKGSNPPFKGFITACFNYVPFCYVLKTAPEKIGYLFLFLFSIALYLALTHLKNKIFFIIFSIYILVISIPIVTGKYLPDKQINKNQYSTKKYIEPKIFKQFRSDMSKKKLEARVLSLPTYRNYNVLINLHDNKYFLGVDPLLQNIPQSFIASYSMEGSENYLFPFDSNFEKNILSIYSIRYLSYNNLLTPWIGNVTEEEIQNEKEFTKNNFKIIKNYNKIQIYENESFLPKIYVPQKIIITDQSIANFFNSLQEPIQEKRLAVFFRNQNTKISQVQQIRDTTKEFSNLPIIEFKKINPSKYIIRVHQAKESFYLVFNDKFSQNWKIYLNSLNNYNNSPTNLESDFKLDENNILDGVSKEELKDYLNKSWISTKKYDQFISKNFAGSIQNDNLENGHVYEAWFKQPIAATQLVSNSFSNSWFIKTDDLCKTSNNCIINNDKSYDFELIMEFWPQRVYYFGLLISILTFIITMIALYSHVSKKKNENN